MATVRKTVDRVSAIADPRQRAVAARVGEICDWFCTAIVGQPVGQRLRVGEKAGPGEAAWRHRNIARKYALGGVVALATDLELPLREQHGLPPKGRTQILELRGIHPSTSIQCRDLFRALIAEQSACGVLVADLYARLFAQAKAEVEHAEATAGA